MEQIVDYISELTMSDKLIISELQAELISLFRSTLSAIVNDHDLMESRSDRNWNDHYYSIIMDIADRIIFRSGSK